MSQLDQFSAPVLELTEPKRLDQCSSLNKAFLTKDGIKCYIPIFRGKIPPQGPGQLCWWEDKFLVVPSMPDNSKVRGQTRRSPWSCRLGVGHGAKNPTPEKSTVTKPGRRPRRTDFYATYTCGHFKIICRRIAGSCVKLHLYPSSLASLTASSLQGFGKGLLHSDITTAIKHMSVALAHSQFNWPNLAFFSTLTPPQEHMVV
jgi:hypothetical protein